MTDIVKSFGLGVEKNLINFEVLMPLAGKVVKAEKIKDDEKNFTVFFNEFSADFKKSYIGYLAEDTVDPITSTAYEAALEDGKTYMVSSVSTKLVSGVYNFIIELVQTDAPSTKLSFVKPVGNVGTKLFDMDINQKYHLFVFNEKDNYFIIMNDVLYKNTVFNKANFQKTFITVLEEIQYNLNVEATIEKHPRD